VKIAIMLYLDASLLAAALTNEAETERMQHWLRRQPGDNLATSDWVATGSPRPLDQVAERADRIADRAEALATSTGDWVMLVRREV
jgi:uncharacterized protein